MADFHFENKSQLFAEVILPLGIPRAYTYYVPTPFTETIQVGQRVEVQFGKNKLYSGIVSKTHNQAPENTKPKEILSIIDEEPILSQLQLDFWQWIAQYYLANIGDVMNAALPANLKLNSDTYITLSPTFNNDFSDLNDDEYLLVEALTIQEKLSISDIRKITQKKTVTPLIRKMLDSGLIDHFEEMSHKYKPKTQLFFRLTSFYRESEENLNKAFDLCLRSQKQTQVLLSLFKYKNLKEEWTPVTTIKKELDVDSSVFKALEKKKIIELEKQNISRISTLNGDTPENKSTLSESQTIALSELNECFKTKKTALLHGVTGSGKTRIYMEFIQQCMDDNKQALFLLPEIALTTQIVQRLHKFFGPSVAVYHSRLNNNERVEVYKAVKKGIPIIIGPRSAMFLPFKKLGLVIVDEEHDGSYKQHDPSPRYQGRDAALMLSHLHNAKTILGSATPSLESILNTKNGKFGYVRMANRFGNVQMPLIKIVDLKKQYQQNQVKAGFSSPLIEAIQQTIKDKKQVILFKNRRGFSPTMQCNTCGDAIECKHCDVTLTYHKFSNKLQCHYCGSHQSIPNECPKCKSTELSFKGSGTEKVEEDLATQIPNITIKRLDLDTARGKNALSTLITQFEDQEIDVLIGTQMVTKGLDFSNVGLVGVLDADALLAYPDFRSSERAFQLLTQVSGRSGRGKERGLVIIQAMQTEHPVLKEVLEENFKGFYQREQEERKFFNYPPFNRIINITLKHSKPQIVNDAAKIFVSICKPYLKDKIIGPAAPHIARVRNQYLLNVMIKTSHLPAEINQTKKVVYYASNQVKKENGMSNVRINIDIDPN